MDGKVFAMPKLIEKNPSYRVHKPSGQAVVSATRPILA